MAGGSTWFLKSKNGAGQIYQKESNGPWFYRDGMEIVIYRRIKPSNVAFMQNEQGKTSGMISYTVGRVVKTISKAAGEVFVCKGDNVVNDQQLSDNVTCEQVWLWNATEETEI
jgi:hypothetical protein